jgi:hypothetical protein
MLFTLQEITNDNFKRSTAYDNKIINYIEVDCRKSELDWIKNNILKSELTKLINLRDIDWNECAELSYRSLLKKACDLWNSGIKSTVKIGQLLRLDRSTIIRYLKKGEKIGLCNYNSKEEMKKSADANRIKGQKPIICIETGETFNSIAECRRALNILSSGNISAVCIGITILLSKTS